MRIVYMGTPDFAVPCLEKIVQMGHQVAAVVTQPDRPKGRGRKLQPSPVKLAAQKHGLKIYQPEKIKTEEFYKLLKSLQPELIVVVAYGKILPAKILSLPPLGCVNVHASLLPKYRGSAPLHWAIINGEKQTGVTTMYMDEGMDTGDMILKKSIEIHPDATVGELHDRLSVLGAELLEETLKLIEQGKAPRIPQDDGEASYAPMLKREHERIDWTLPAIKIKNHVRGMNPWPGCYTTLDGKVLKVWRVDVIDKNTPHKPGTVVAVEQDSILVQTGMGMVSLLELQLQGGKRLVTADFLRGRPLSPGIVLGSEEEDK